MAPPLGLVAVPLTRAEKVQIALLTCAALLRVWNIREECPWYDEIITLRQLDSGSLAAFLDNVKRENPAVSPIYFVFEYGWSRIFGDSAFALRCLSILLSMVAILCVYFAVRRCFRTAAAFGGEFLEKPYFWPHPGKQSLSALFLLWAGRHDCRGAGYGPASGGMASSLPAIVTQVFASRVSVASPQRMVTPPDFGCIEKGRGGVVRPASSVIS